MVVTLATWALAAAAMAFAIVHQRSQSEPIGEWQVFLDDTAIATEIALTSDFEEEGVRHARNELGIVAVSLVNDSGAVVASTSENLTGTTLSNPLFAFAMDNDRFVGLAGSVSEPLFIDGVMEWEAGSVLYEVLDPLPTGDGFILLHYDISALLGRRTPPGTIDSLTIQLLALGGIFVLLGTGVFVGHSRAVRRHRELVVESDLLRKHSRELEEANVKLAEARQRAERALALAEEKMRIRSEFVLMINHELRTPLTSVVTGAELIRNEDLDPSERREVVDSMIANGKRLNEIIDQILAVARMENTGLAYETQAVPLADVCEATGAVASGEAGQEHEEISVQTDTRTLSLVINSLADNARTHGAMNVAIEARLEPLVEPMMELGDRPVTAVFLTVGDDGPGIEPEFLPRAFEKFEKNSFSSGTGLGLYMVHMMVVALGGSIGVNTSPAGTTFQIALPARIGDRVMEGV